MDKYEFNLKVEQLNKLVKLGDYKTAMRITDTIDWRRVHNAGLLTTVSEVYEKNGEYREAREILLLAYDRAPVGKRILYKLTMLSLKESDIAEACAYYNEYIDISPKDSRRYVLEYLIGKEKGIDIDKKIEILEKYNETEIDEQWKFELARLYSEAGRADDCVRVCDDIMLLFGVGNYVERAAALKESMGYPLSIQQRKLVDNKEYYEDRLRSLAARYESGVKENFPNLGLDNLDEYMPKEDIKTTIDLGGVQETVPENISINTALFPKAGGEHNIRIAQETFEGESVSPEFEIELQRAIAVTKEHISEMKDGKNHSSMEEIDEEVRAHMERVERRKHGGADRRQTGISSHFDSMGIPKSYGSFVDREENSEAQLPARNMAISEDTDTKTDTAFECQLSGLATDSAARELVAQGLPGGVAEEPTVPDLLYAETGIDCNETAGNLSDSGTGSGIDSSIAADLSEAATDAGISYGETAVEENLSDSNVNEEPEQNIMVTQTESTRVMENYVPERINPIFDEDDLINSYFDEEVEGRVPTVSEVLAKRQGQKAEIALDDIDSKSTISSEERMEVIGDEEVYYTKEERTFITRVKKDKHSDEAVPQSGTVSNAVQCERQGQKAETENEDEPEETVTIEESFAEEEAESEVEVLGRVMKAKAPRSTEPREYLMRRPGSIIVEGISVQKAFENAVEVLKEVNELTKIKHAVLKIRANSLNAIGVMNSVDRIKGKDLIIEEAGALSDRTIAELIEFVIDGRQTVVFSDTISGIARLIEANDLLHSMSIVMREEEEEIPAKKNVVANIVLMDKDGSCLKEAAKGSDNITAEEEAYEAEVFEAEENKAEAESDIRCEYADDADEYAVIKNNDECSDESEDSKMFEDEEQAASVNFRHEKKRMEASTDDDKNEILDTDEFIEYALDYAAKIDCVISDRTKLALEERVDYMKEDETPLSRKNAISLIESAADLAENPNIVKRVFGFISPKFNREGKLILREEHFRI